MVYVSKDKILKGIEIVISVTDANQKLLKKRLLLEDVFADFSELTKELYKKRIEQFAVNKELFEGMLKGEFNVDLAVESDSTQKEFESLIADIEEFAEKLDQLQDEIAVLQDKENSLGHSLKKIIGEINKELKSTS